MLYILLSINRTCAPLSFTAIPSTRSVTHGTGSALAPRLAGADGPVGSPPLRLVGAHSSRTTTPRRNTSRPSDISLVPVSSGRKVARRAHESRLGYGLRVSQLRRNMATLTCTRRLTSDRRVCESRVTTVNHMMLAILAYVLLAKDGTSVSLTHHYANDVDHYDATINNSDNTNFLKNFYLTGEQKWHKDTIVPISLLPLTKGMPARSHHRIRQSVTGLDDAGMDLQVAQLNTRTDKEIHSRATVSWLDWQLPLFITLCAIAGTILFIFLILLWLRKQMSREKDIEDGDRQGLVEDSASCPSDKLTKDAKGSVEAKWIHETGARPPAPAHATRPIPTTSSLPEVMSITTPERRPEPIRIKAKGLLERRGSSTSLTIELAQAPESPPHMVTPTRECTAEEFLLSVGNVLSRAQLKRVVNNPAMLHKEFWEVPLNLPEKVDICGAGVKNRYCSVLPNPQSRVILPSSSSDPLAGYINANYIRGYDGEDVRYIATQGPLAHTIADFWRMIWAERVPVVVMMTRLHEASKAKCDPYFPFDVDSRIQIGSFTIIVNYIDTRNGYIVRTMEIRHEGEKRHLQHYWYDSWPDHAVPQAADALVSMAAEVNSLPGPVVVHCSAGIGRTGCFIALAIGMIQLVRDGNVDVLGILCQMRYDRGGMVQTAEQYEFVHRALYLFEQTLDGQPSTSSN